MELNETSLKEFRKILSWLLNNKHSDFYRKKYSDKKIPKSIKTVEDFKNLPFLTRQDITATNPFERTFIPLSKTRGVTITSGTSGAGALISFFGDVKIRFGGKKIAKVEFNALITGVKRLKIRRIFFLRPAFAINTLGLFVNDRYGPLPVFGDINNLSLSAQVVAKLEVDALNMTSTTLYFFTPYLKELYDLKKIRYIGIGGEYCSQAKLNLLKRTFPNAFIMGVYSGSEDGLKGWQCSVYGGKSMSFFHMMPYSIYECLDIETGESLGPGKMGELVFTSLDRSQFVPIRYKTGDLIRIREERCKCGSREPLFEIFGRVGIDSVTMQGATLLTSDVLRVIEKTRGLKLDFKAHVYEKILNGRICYAIELWCVPKNKKNIGNQKYIERMGKKIEGDLHLSSRLTYHDLVKKDLLLPLKLVLTEEFPFEPKRKHFVQHY